MIPPISDDSLEYLNICDNLCNFGDKNHRFTPQLQQIKVPQDLSEALAAAQKRMARLEAVNPMTEKGISWFQKIRSR